MKNIKNKVFITGISGQDGSILAKMFLELNYKIYGLVRDESSSRLWRISSILKDIELIKGDILDYTVLENNLKTIKPDLIFNMASISNVKYSFESPIYVSEVTGIGALRLIEAVRQSSKKSKVYQASTSEQFGDTSESPQSEFTKFSPCTPYGIAKTFAHNIMVMYRKAYNMYISCGICYSHEHETRDEFTLSQKVISGVVAILKAQKEGYSKEKLLLGNLNSAKDWGYAEDYCKAMILIMKQSKPDDYVVATSQLHTVKEFVQIAFNYVKIPHWEDYVKIDKNLFRPLETNKLVGNYSKIAALGWKPTITFEQMIEKLIKYKLNKNV